MLNGVKVILCESADVGLKIAHQCLASHQTLVVATQQIRALFFKFSPKVKNYPNSCVTAAEFLQNLLKRLNLPQQFLPNSYAPLFLKKENLHAEDSLFLLNQAIQHLEQSERIKIETWLKSKNWTLPYLWAQNLQQTMSKQDKIVLYGPFDPLLYGSFFKILKAHVESIEWICFQKPFNFDSFNQIKNYKNTQLTLPTNKCVYCFSSLHEELAFHINKKIDPLEAYIILDKTLEFLKKTPDQEEQSTYAWLRWLELGTAESFLEYATYLRNSHLVEADLYRSIRHDLMEAVHTCLTDQYNVLQTYLLKVNKPWIVQFLRPEWPEENTWNGFLEFLLPSLQSHQAWLGKDLFIEQFGYPFHLSRTRFFEILKNCFPYQKDTVETLYIRPETARCFPFQNYTIPLANYEYWGSEAETLKKYVSHWESTGYNVQVTYAKPSCDEVLTPLWPSSDIYCPEIKETKLLPSLEVFPLRPRTTLQLETKDLQLSCKAWERLKCAPWQTWLEAILKVRSQLNFQDVCSKSKILGEWVHAALQFSQKPAHLTEWEKAIDSYFQKQLGMLQSYYKSSKQAFPYFIPQWIDSAQMAAKNIAQSCEKFLQVDWTLHSEWNLPLQKGFPSGRVDLLAYRGSSLETAEELVVVDYKTAAHYHFIPSKINQGEGLQLVLYGWNLQTLSEGPITLSVVGPQREQSQQLDSLGPKLESIKQWLKITQSTGEISVDFPESAAKLPLAFQPLNNAIDFL